MRVVKSRLTTLLNLKAARESRRITLRKAALETGISYSTLRLFDEKRLSFKGLNLDCSRVTARQAPSLLYDCRVTAR